MAKLLNTKLDYNGQISLASLSAHHQHLHMMVAAVCRRTEPIKKIASIISFLGFHNPIPAILVRLVLHQDTRFHLLHVSLVA